MRPQDLIGHDLYDSSGQKIGRVGEVYLDSATREPGWAAVRVGQRETYVPLSGARPGDLGTQVDIPTDLVTAAPPAEGALTEATAAQLCRYYGLPEGAPPIPVQRVPKPSDMPKRSPAPH